MHSVLLYAAEASAYHISATAIRRIFWAMDGYNPDPATPIPDVTAAYKLMMAYFKVRNRASRTAT